MFYIVKTLHLRAQFLFATYLAKQTLDSYAPFQVPRYFQDSFLFPRIAIYLEICFRPFLLNT